MQGETSFLDFALKSFPGGLLQIVDLLCLHSFPSVERCCFCWLLAEHAVHAEMAGKTDMLVDSGIIFLHMFLLSLPLLRGV